MPNPDKPQFPLKWHERRSVLKLRVESAKQIDRVINSLRQMLVGNQPSFQSRERQSFLLNQNTDITPENLREVLAGIAIVGSGAVLSALFYILTHPVR